MKIYLTDNAIIKLTDMIQTEQSGTISARKYKKETDPPSNVFQGIKLTENHRTQHKTGKPYTIYINKERLKEIKKIIAERSSGSAKKKQGGIIPLIPLILGGIGALGSLAGGAAGIAKTVLDKKNNDAKLDEEQRHNKELEKAARGGDGLYLSPWKGYGMDLNVKDFINNSKLDDIGKKSLRNIIKNLSNHFKIERQGNGLYLSYPQ
jgi:hypothetical protein